MPPLRDYLLDAYGGFADRRCTDRTLDRAIKIDDQGPRDVYPGFCTIAVSVPDRIGRALTLTLRRCPPGPEVVELVETLGGTVRPADFGPTVTLHLKSSQGPAIRRLAGAIEAIVGKGRRYDDPNLVWICDRTARSLERLAEQLDLYCEESRSDPTPVPGAKPDPRSQHFLAGPWASGPRLPDRSPRRAPAAASGPGAPGTSTPGT